MAGAGEGEDEHEHEVSFSPHLPPSCSPPLTVCLSGHWCWCLVNAGLLPVNGVGGQRLLKDKVSPSPHLPPIVPSEPVPMPPSVLPLPPPWAPCAPGPVPLVLDGEDEAEGAPCAPGPVPLVLDGEDEAEDAINASPLLPPHSVPHELVLPPTSLSLAGLGMLHEGFDSSHPLPPGGHP